ncbi:VRR-NUC domain-containing protein [Aquabacterium sp.]|uniref:VRR-NUC domain-containing protein n=1 Tax=Aquabacterium sp. TaxID=1872578 RepID=UPI00248761A2|nr:VRR-NUC domain-containing protein [Aquabacterium sp.]MDI1348758.1 VRR-NUC domain-containing protein [Aquabacterium sp.]
MAGPVPILLVGAGQQVEGLSMEALPDLFGLEPIKPRHHTKPEAAALAEVLRALSTHQSVAWVRRMNSGAAKVGNRFIRFGWPGCPDLLGQMKDGRLLGVEVKRAKGGRVSDEQRHFLALIKQAGGMAFVARDCRDVFKELGR